MKVKKIETVLPRIGDVVVKPAARYSGDESTYFLVVDFVCTVSGTQAVCREIIDRLYLSAATVTISPDRIVTHASAQWLSDAAPGVDHFVADNSRGHYWTGPVSGDITQYNMLIQRIQELERRVMSVPGACGVIDR
ncbi:MAG: hypothetical protein WC551_08670 [Patescibacteria group bacterium]